MECLHAVASLFSIARLANAPEKNIKYVGDAHFSGTPLVSLGGGVVFFLWWLLVTFFLFGCDAAIYLAFIGMGRLFYLPCY